MGKSGNSKDALQDGYINQIQPTWFWKKCDSEFSLLDVTMIVSWTYAIVIKSSRECLFKTVPRHGFECADTAILPYPVFDFVFL